MPGWLVTNETTEVRNGKRATTYTWDARSPYDCITDLIVLCKSLRVGLEGQYNNIVPSSVKKLGKVFDVEEIVRQLCKFKVEDGKLILAREDRIEWETSGSNEFHEFYQHVCSLPHVHALADANHDMDLLPTDSHAVLKKFKNTLQKIFWMGLGSCVEELFVDRQGEVVVEFKNSRMIMLSELKAKLLDVWFEISFDSGVVVEARLIEENLVAAFYVNSCIYEALGPEICIVLDVALAAGGCEAVVEGFYSLVKAHKKAGGQGNEMLVKRAVVDWSLPDPLSCPKTMEEIGQLYTEGNKKLGLSKHRLPIFSDERYVLQGGTT